MGTAAADGHIEGVVKDEVKVFARVGKELDPVLVRPVAEQIRLDHGVGLDQRVFVADDESLRVPGAEVVGGCVARGGDEAGLAGDVPRSLHGVRFGADDSRESTRRCGCRNRTAKEQSPVLPGSAHAVCPPFPRTKRKAFSPKTTPDPFPKTRR
jgi:hypothetical protein